ncbi:ATP-binding protein [Streptomyces sp. ST2-7A]|uniref:ATP-binding protein n=1 Tax=Streptomyces sp. ST2-7A TaxID=2907214 RepID=UPI0035AC0075
MPYSCATTASPEVVRRLREEVASLVRGWGGCPDAVALVRLGVSELITNVIKHVEDPRCRLEVHHLGNEVRVRLFDRCREVPAVTIPAWSAEGGRGLLLLRDMTTSLGYTCVPGGKWVWFTVPMEPVGQS